jgi:hypothetical protein
MEVLLLLSLGSVEPRRRVQEAAIEVCYSLRVGCELFRPMMMYV